MLRIRPALMSAFGVTPEAANDTQVSWVLNKYPNKEFAQSELIDINRQRREKRLVPLRWLKEAPIAPRYSMIAWRVAQEVYR